MDSTPDKSVRQPAGRAPWRWWAGAGGVLALSSVLFFAHLGARLLWSSELEWAEIAREMVRSSNYFWPTINGSVWFWKGLGTYWAVVAASYLTGGINETAARLPSAVAGLVAVALLMFLVWRLYDGRNALLAGFILATSLSFVFYSRTASADVEIITGELAALLLFIHHEDHPDGWWVLPFWLIMAVTGQTKGPVGFVLPILVIGVYCTLADGWREFFDGVLFGSLARRMRWVIEHNRWLFNRKSMPAAMVGGAVYYLPFEISRIQMRSNQGIAGAFHENVERFFRPFDHRMPIYLYVYVIFALMAPWSVFLPAALTRIHQARASGDEPARSDRFTLVYFWATFVFFTCCGSRRSYYILPILPVAAIVVARLLTASQQSLSTAARRLTNVGFGLLAVTVAGGILLLLPPSTLLPAPWNRLPPAPDRVIYGACWFVSAAAITYAAARFRPKVIMLSLCVVAYLSMVYIFIFAMPSADAWRDEKAFSQRVVKLLGHGTKQLALFRLEAPSSARLFYLDSPQPLPEFDSTADLERAVSDGGIRWVIIKRSDMPAISLGTRAIDSEATYPWESTHHRLNKLILVEMEDQARALQRAPSRAASGRPAAGESKH